MGRLQFHHAGVILLLTFILSFSSFQFIPMDGNSVHLETFSTGTEEVTLTFETGGTDGTHLQIEIPANASILSASLNVTGKPYEGNYPTDVTVNIGNDEDIDWAFMGTGYGSLGHQTFFSDGSKKQYLMFHNTTFQNKGKILLPRNATVIKSELILEGGTGTLSELFFVTANYYGELYYIQYSGSSFLPPDFIQDVGSYCYGVGLGDFDNDGDMDIVSVDGVSSSSPCNLYFIEKIGTGNNFADKVLIGTIASGRYSSDFATGDFDNDGNIDFVFSRYNPNLYFFHGNGDGTFVQSTISTSGGPSYIYGKDAADCNGDGNLDVVFGGSNSNRLYYLEGNGDGTFKTLKSITATGVGSSQWCVITDDFDNNGTVDILSGDSDGELYILQGNGDGTFKLPVKTIIDAGGYSPGDAWDFDNNGNVDVVAADTYGSLSNVYYFQGDGMGDFSSGSPIGTVGRTCYSVAAPPPKIIGAKNAKLDVGDEGEGIYEWEFTGVFEDVIEHVDENIFQQKLNSLLLSPNYPIIRDEFGNEFVKIPLNFTADKDSGLIRLKALNIEYVYKAPIYQKGLDNIVNELNDHIIYTDSEIVKIHFVVASQTSGILEFSDLDIIYNIPPELGNDIPTITAYEDTENLQLLDLSTFFRDTDESTLKLNYSVVQNTEADHVDVFTNYTHWLKIRPITPNWYGETSVVIQVIDAGKKITYSNEFIIDIQAVNDEPAPKHSLPDVMLVEGGKEFELDLDLREYFTDVEDDYLYYELAIDPENKYEPYKKRITALIDDENIITIDSIGDFNTDQNGTNWPVPIWIYCDDDIDINTYEDGLGNFSRQEILITVLPVNDPPEWESMPDIILNEDDTPSFYQILNLKDYLHDDETPNKDLTIQIIGNSNPTIDATLSSGYLSITAPENYYGETVVLFRGSEPNPAFFCDATVKIELLPINDAPTINILSPFNYADVNETIEISGSVFDIEEHIQLVEIKFDSHDTISSEAVHFDWQEAEVEHNENSWSYDWDTTTVPDGNYRVTVRVYDGELADEAMVNLGVRNNRNLEPVVDIVTPVENEEVNGSVVIKGWVNDPDNNGIEILKIRIGQDMDWTEIPLTEKMGTIDWFYLWESTKVTDGPIVISAKAWDGRSWSAPKNRLISVKNGINETADKSTEATDKADEDYSLLYVIVGLIAVIIIIGLLVIFSMVRRAKKKVEEYVPDGRIEPIEDLEARLKPELGPGVSIEHAPLPAAPAGGLAPQLPRLPAAGMGIAVAGAVHPVTPLTLPPAAIITTESSGAVVTPALPPARVHAQAAPAPADAATATKGDGYGVYSAQPAGPSQPVTLPEKGSYQAPPIASQVAPAAKPKTSPDESN